MALSMIGTTPEALTDAKEWLKRASINAKASSVLVKQDDPDLRVEAVTQVQQACEKATKAILLANGTSYREVTDMGHNTIGAFVSLIAQTMGDNPIAGSVSDALLTNQATESALKIAKAVLSGPRNRKRRNAVIYVFKQVLPPSSENLGNKAIEVADWDRLARAFPPMVVESLIEMHEGFIDTWSQYVNEIPNMYADPRPLLAKEVSAETWVFGPAYAGLPRRFPGQEADSPPNPVLANISQELLRDFMEQHFSHVDQSQWPEAVSIRDALLYIGNWLTSLLWLFLCGMATTPHAVSSRYPAEEPPSKKEMGSQHYDRRLGVVACIGPLSDHTEAAIRKLIAIYRQLERIYREMSQSPLRG